MTLSQIMSALKSQLNSSSIDFNQVESYEGQFEDAKNFIIKPPSAFVDIPSGGKSDKLANGKGVNVNIYISTGNLHSKAQTNTMLNVIDTISTEIEESSLLSEQIVKYTGFEKLGNYPGFKLYQVNFRID